MDILKKINYIFDKNQKLSVFFLLVLIIIGAFLELLGVSIILPFVNAILEPERLMANQFVSIVCSWIHVRDVDQLVLWIVFAIIMIYIGKNLFLIFMYNKQYSFVYDNCGKLSRRMMKCYMEQPYAYHLKHNSAELIRNIMHDTMAFFSVVQGLLQLTTEVCVCIVLAVFLFAQDVFVTISLCILLILLMVIFLRALQKKIKEMGMESRRYDAIVNKNVLQGLAGIKEVKVLNREKYFIDEFGNNYIRFSEVQRKYQVYSIIPKPVTETVCIVGIMTTIAIKIVMGGNPEALVSIMATFAIAAFRLLPSFNRITNSISTIIFNLPAVGALYEDLKGIDEFQQLEFVNEKITKDLPFEKEIVFEQVSFSYPDTNKKVIDGVSLTIPKNKSVAFIGPSGEGKTTLADILLGIHEPQHGSIKVDGKDITKYKKAWHEKLGYIPQGIYLMDDTIRNNVLFGIPGKYADEAAIWKSLEDAQIKEFVLSLEDGLDTIVGERGTRLSGGQMQRIGIARALYQNPEILVLDEATSALDNDTEKAVMDAIAQLAGKKTLVIIAHRLSTIRDCDYVYEVKGGKAVLHSVKEPVQHEQKDEIRDK